MNPSSDHHTTALLLGILLPISALLILSAWYFQHIHKNRRKRQLVEVSSGRRDMSISGCKDTGVYTAPCCQTDEENIVEPSYSDKTSPALSIQEGPSSSRYTIIPDTVWTVQSPLEGLVTHLRNSSQTLSICTLDLHGSSTSSTASPRSTHEERFIVESETLEVVSASVALNAHTIGAVSFDTIPSSVNLMAYGPLYQRPSGPYALSVGRTVSFGSGILQSGAEMEREEQAEICWPSVEDLTLAI